MDAADLDERSRRTLYSGSSTAMWNLLLGHPDDKWAELPQQVITESDHAGSLIVVGTGIRTLGQLTLGALCHMREASFVYYLVADPLTEEVIRSLNPKGAVSLKGHYGEGVPRKHSYETMVQQILGSVREGKRTCAAFYGHPGVFAFPSHESIRRARDEGYIARMLPGVSAEDCLFADLGIDPSVNGCQSYEATDYLIHDRNVDTSSQLILWQIGVLGDLTYRNAGYSPHTVFPMLISRLCQLYGANHLTTVYEAAILPGLAPHIKQIQLGLLAPEHVSAMSTLYIPPARKNLANREIALAMGLVR